MPCLAQANDVELSVTGLKGELEDNVEAYLSSIPASEYSVSLRFQSRLEESITQALNALGYYHPTFKFEVIEDGSDTKLVVNVAKGPSVKIKEVDILVSGEAEKDRAFRRLIRQSGIKEGKRLKHNQYDSLKSGMTNLALQRGYFDGEFTLSRLEVVPELNEAMILLHYDSGIRYHFGETSVSGSQIDDDRVRSIQPYTQGDPYLVSQVGEYNQNLSNTDWFSSVFVEPDLSYLGKSRELPVKVSLAPQARNKIETGIGYSTDVGVRGTLKWKKPWVNAKGHSFDSSFSLSQPEQTITASYQIPLDDVLNDYYRIAYGMKHVDKRDTKSIESNLAVERHWLLESGWHRTAYVRYLIENYEQGLQDDAAQFVLPGISYSRTRTRGGPMPYTGQRVNLTLEVGSNDMLSETDVLRVMGGAGWIHSMGRNHRAIFRLDGGANITDELDKLSPSLRFFAGGDNSIRGYGYESISPRDSSGSLTGAKYIATSSLEYQYRLTGKWWGALFYDIGDAFNDTPDWHRGTGVGIRWGSPVGPIRLDFAWGLDASPGDEFRIHFSLGPEL